jgi:prepilin-type N-terminal cleavage/methylation domain-containing protein
MQNDRQLPLAIRDDSDRGGFTLIELLVVIAIIAVLASMLLPALSRVKDKAQASIDVNNVKQICTATAMYTTDNTDYMPHPTWGTVNGGNSGPDGWAYGVANNNRLAGSPAYIPSAQGQAYGSATYKTQLEFFKIGQLGKYLVNYKIMDCPKDVADRGGGRFKTWADARYVKITSYCMNGTIGGYCPTDVGFAGRTYKITSFKPMDIYLWEQNETDGFYFNDAGNNPETAGEIVSQRHAGNMGYTGNVNRGGGAMIGRVGGTAHFIKMGAFMNFVAAGASRPNDVLNGPGYK